MEILYRDRAVLVCRKDAGLLSTDEPGGVPESLRQLLGEPEAELRTVHRLDRVVGGLMVLGCSASAASELSRQIREGQFRKEYLAAVHGLTPEEGSLRDLMWRDKARKMSFVVPRPGKDVQEALLDYRRLDTAGELSLVRVRLHTGRSHQIRCQFSSRGLPLWGDKKYSTLPDDGPIALWSHCLHFAHPDTGEILCFEQDPPEIEPWTSLW